MYFSMSKYIRYSVIQNFRMSYLGLSTILKRNLKFLEDKDFLILSKWMVVITYILSTVSFLLSVVILFIYKDNHFVTIGLTCFPLVVFLQSLMSRNHIEKIDEFFFIRRINKVGIIQFIWWISDGTMLKILSIAIGVFFIISSNWYNLTSLVFSLLFSYFFYKVRINKLSRQKIVNKAKYKKISYQVALKRSDYYLKLNKFIVWMTMFIVCITVIFLYLELSN